MTAAPLKLSHQQRRVSGTVRLSGRQTVPCHPKHSGHSLLTRFQFQVTRANDLVGDTTPKARNHLLTCIRDGRDVRRGMRVPWRQQSSRKRKGRASSFHLFFFLAWTQSFDTVQIQSVVRDHAFRSLINQVFKVWLEP